MRAVVQRVSSARVTVDGRTTGEIPQGGLLILLAVGPRDTESDGEWLARKIASLRIFPDPAGQMNRSVIDVNGGLLVISQFTLYASTRKGTRPSFNDAAPPDLGERLYQTFLTQLSQAAARSVACGEFGAHMEVALVNDGPVTLWIDTERKD
ncbi:MAG: D-tyrosyl-tRNA(Tyr) deacylase [Opitutaceae bacterium]|jgi:D-tyrosyl-tRNA(Tyr) deacylase|nr:D-tyrosyl-tRNA(Tyr) deacylase [Opitutaceae bacterium]